MSWRIPAQPSSTKPTCFRLRQRRRICRGDAPRRAISIGSGCPVSSALPPERRRRWSRRQERTWTAEHAWREPRGASSCQCRGEQKESWSFVVISVYVCTFKHLAAQLRLDLCETRDRRRGLLGILADPFHLLGRWRVAVVPDLDRQPVHPGRQVDVSRIFRVAA